MQHPREHDGSHISSFSTRNVKRGCDMDPKEFAQKVDLHVQSFGKNTEGKLRLKEERLHQRCTGSAKA